MEKIVEPCGIVVGLTLAVPVPEEITVVSTLPVDPASETNSPASFGFKERKPPARFCLGQPLVQGFDLQHPKKAG